MNGQYYRTALHDITSSNGWFKKLLLLGLIDFIPVFGQMTVYGYAYEWAHKAAWGMQTSMPEKIYGRKNSKMLRWGWFNIVIGIVMAIIPIIIVWIGNALTGINANDEITYYHRAPSAGSYIASGFGTLFVVVGYILTFVAMFFTWIGSMRMTVYNRLGSGLQFKQIWTMLKKDFGGIMRIFGMELIFMLIAGIVLFFIMLIVMFTAFFSVGISAAGNLPYMYGGGDSGRMVFDILLSMVLVTLPLFIVLVYAFSVYDVFVQLLVTRALGYWTRQFDVAHWGKDTDPLPFEREASANDGTPIAPNAGAANQYQGYQAPTGQQQANPYAQQPTQQQAAQQPQAQESPTGEQTQPALASQATVGTPAQGQPVSDVSAASEPQAAPSTQDSAVPQSAAPVETAPGAAGDESPTSTSAADAPKAASEASAPAADSTETNAPTTQATPMPPVSEQPQTPSNPGEDVPSDKSEPDKQ